MNINNDKEILSQNRDASKYPPSKNTLPISPNTMISGVRGRGKKVQRSKFQKHVTPEVSIKLPKKISKEESIPSPFLECDPKNSLAPKESPFSQYGLSEKACQVLRNIAESMPSSGHFSLLINLANSLHQKLSFIETLTPSGKSFVITEFLQEFQKKAYLVTYLSLIQEILIYVKRSEIFPNIIEKYLTVKQFFPSLDEEHSLLRTREELLRTIISEEFTLQIESRTLQVKTKQAKEKITALLNEEKNKILIHLNEIHDTFQTLQELLKLPTDIFCIITQNKIGTILSWNAFYKEIPSLNEWESYKQCFIKLWETAASCRICEAQSVKFFTILFGCIRKMVECPSWTLEECMENSFLIKESLDKVDFSLVKTKKLLYEIIRGNLTYECYLKENNLPSDRKKTPEEFGAMILNALCFEGLFSEYSKYLNDVLTSYPTKIKLCISEQNLLHLDIISKKITLLEEEKSFDLDLSNYLIEDLFKNFSLYCENSHLEGVKKSFQGIVDLTDKTTRDSIVNAINNINAKLFASILYSEKNKFQDFKKEVINFNNQLRKGCKCLEDILRSSPMSLKEFLYLKEKTVTFIKDISRIYRPLVDFPFVLDNLAYFKNTKSKSKKEYLFNLEDQDLESLVIDFEKIQQEKIFLEEQPFPLCNSTEKSRESMIKESLEQENEALESALLEKELEELYLLNKKYQEKKYAASEPEFPLLNTPQVLQEKIEFPRTTRLKKVLKYLIKDKNWTFISIRGDHLKLTLGDRSLTIIPISSAHLRPGTRSKIKNQTEI